MEEPLAYPLIFLTKKYLSALSKEISTLSIDRYFYVLILIDNHDENLSQKILADLLQIDKSYMVTILNYLEDNGYILRQKNANDRREQLIKLTSKAKEDIPLIRNTISELNNRSLKNISESKKQIFNDVLRIMRSNLSDIVLNKSCSLLKNFN